MSIIFENIATVLQYLNNQFNLFVPYSMDQPVELCVNTSGDGWRLSQKRI